MERDPKAARHTWKSDIHSLTGSQDAENNIQVFKTQVHVLSERESPALDTYL